MWIDNIKVENDAAVNIRDGKYDMYLKQMDNIKAKEILNLKMSNSQKTSFDCLVNRFKMINNFLN